MEKSSMVWLIIAGIVFFVLGGGAGIIYSQKMVSELPQGLLSNQQPNLSDNLLKTLTSNVLLPVVAYGKVTQINGRGVSIEIGGSTLTVKINQDAKIYFSLESTNATKTGKASTVQPEARFEDIKVGDNLNIYIKFLPDGSFGGQTVYIFASSASGNIK